MQLIEGFELTWRRLTIGWIGILIIFFLVILIFGLQNIADAILVFVPLIILSAAMVGYWTRQKFGRYALWLFEFLFAVVVLLAMIGGFYSSEPANTYSDFISGLIKYSVASPGFVFGLLLYKGSYSNFIFGMLQYFTLLGITLLCLAKTGESKAPDSKLKAFFK